MQLLSLSHQNAIFYSPYLCIPGQDFQKHEILGNPLEVLPKCSSFHTVPSDLPLGNPAFSKPLGALRSEKSFLKALSVLKMEIIHPSKKH